jgi:hypothetical protein
MVARGNSRSLYLSVVVATKYGKLDLGRDLFVVGMTNYHLSASALTFEFALTPLTAVIGGAIEVIEGALKDRDQGEELVATKLAALDEDAARRAALRLANEGPLHMSDDGD